MHSGYDWMNRCVADVVTLSAPQCKGCIAMVGLPLAADSVRCSFNAKRVRLGVANVEQAFCAKKVCLDLMQKLKCHPLTASIRRRKKKNQSHQRTARTTGCMWLHMTAVWILRRPEVPLQIPSYERREEKLLFDVTSLWDLIAVAGYNALWFSASTDI
jgi:hypothetical protein